MRHVNVECLELASVSCACRVELVCYMNVE